jgi:predicted SnoaL-like aldol condensation-catalyzing enzyme
MTTTAEQNKRLVLEAFDTLFNERDYAAAEKFWSRQYIQHSALIEPGRERLFNLVKSFSMSRMSMSLGIFKKRFTASLDLEKPGSSY